MIVQNLDFKETQECEILTMPIDMPNGNYRSKKHGTSKYLR